MVRVWFNSETFNLPGFLCDVTPDLRRKPPLIYFRQWRHLHQYPLKNTLVFQILKRATSRWWMQAPQKNKGVLYREHLMVADQGNSIWPRMKKKKKKERGKAKKAKGWINKNITIKLFPSDGCVHWVFVFLGVCSIWHTLKGTQYTQSPSLSCVVLWLPQSFTRVIKFTEGVAGKKSWESHRCLLLSICRLEDLQLALHHICSSSRWFLPVCFQSVLHRIRRFVIPLASFGLGQVVMLSVFTGDL